MLSRLAIPHASRLLSRRGCSIFSPLCTSVRPGPGPDPITGRERRRVLPSIEEIRSYSPAELEHARLDLEEAIELMRSNYAPSLDARKAQLLRLLAATHLRLGGAMDAEPALDEALDLEERAKAMSGEYAGGVAAHRETVFLLAVTNQKLGRTFKARRAFEKIIDEDDSFWRARFHLGLMQINAGKYEEASELLERVCQDSPGHEMAEDLLKKLEERRKAQNIEYDVPKDSDLFNQ